MSSSSPSPERGPGSTLQRLLPLVLLGVSFLLLFQFFPQFFGAPEAATPTPADTALATPGPAATAAPDDSTRTQVWNMVLVSPLESGLRFLVNDLRLGAGSAIILFTILVKVVLLPLSIQQIRSQKSMAALQPEIKALQKRHAKDKEKLSTETMALYKQHGVNPAAGCFPILLQMPVLFGLYAALANLGTQLTPENEEFQKQWFWVGSLAQPDIFILAGITLPFILPVLAAITQWVQQRMMTQPSEDPQQRMQNQMMQFMPLMMLWFGISFSAGLALYWVTQNVLGIIQQYFATGLGSLATLLPGRGTSPSTALAAKRNDGGAGRANGTGTSNGSGSSGARADGQKDGTGPSGRNRNERRGENRTGSGEGRRTSGKR